jgi:putative oxidoreductase
MQFMKQYEAQTYALMRIISGFLFLWHGTQKLLGYPPASYDPPWHVTYIAGGIELVGGVLIMIGLFTAPAAFLASGLMAAAYWMAHASFDSNFLPILNRGELAIMWCFVFLYMSAKGSGIWSIDARRA